MLPKDMRIKSGNFGGPATVVVDHTTGKAFSVLCNCGSSRPRRHTQMYVSKHREEFSTVADWDAQVRKAAEEAKIRAEAPENTTQTTQTTEQENTRCSDNQSLTGESSKPPVDAATAPTTPPPTASE